MNINSLPFDRRFDAAKAACECLVEGDGYTAYEKFVCYLKVYTDEQWVQINPGKMETVGHINNRPITLQIFFNEIDGHVIGFYDSHSQLVDWIMIGEYLDKNYPGIKRTDMNNFHPRSITEKR